MCAANFLTDIIFIIGNWRIAFRSWEESTWKSSLCSQPWKLHLPYESSEVVLRKAAGILGARESSEQQGLLRQWAACAAQNVPHSCGDGAIYRQAERRPEGAASASSHGGHDGQSQKMDLHDR